MTALFLAVEPSRITIMSDGAACDSDGRVIRATSKQILIPALECVIAVAGCGSAHQHMHALLQMYPFRTFDELITAIPDLFCGLMQHVEENDECAKIQTTTLFIGGRSQGADAMQGFVIHSGEDHRFGLERFQIGPVVGALSPCITDEEFQRLAHRDMGAVTAERFGLRYMEAARHRDLIATSGSPCGVGCFVQRSTISREDGITSRIVHRWPDAVGTLIEPEPDARW